MSVRGDLLAKAAALTDNDRNRSYGDPYENLSLAGRLKEVFYSGAKRPISPGEREALDLIFTKLSRIGVGSAVIEDNYVDGAAYFAIAYECALASAQKKAGTTLDDGIWSDKNPYVGITVPQLGG